MHFLFVVRDRILKKLYVTFNFKHNMQIKRKRILLVALFTNPLGDTYTSLITFKTKLISMYLGLTWGKTPTVLKECISGEIKCPKRSHIKGQCTLHAIPLGNILSVCQSFEIELALWGEGLF